MSKVSAKASAAPATASKLSLVRAAPGRLPIGCRSPGLVFHAASIPWLPYLTPCIFIACLLSPLPRRLPSPHWHRLASSGRAGGADGQEVAHYFDHAILRDPRDGGVVPSGDGSDERLPFVRKG